MVVAPPPPPPEHPIVASLEKENFTSEEIAKVKALVTEKLNDPKITPDERVAAFKELKKLPLCSGVRVDPEMMWAHQMDRAVNHSPMDFKKSYSGGAGYNKGGGYQ